MGGQRLRDDDTAGTGGGEVSGAATRILLSWQRIALFHVDCVPVGQARARAYVTKSGHAGVYDAGNATSFKQALAWTAKLYRPQVLLTCPVRVSWTAYFPRPKALCRAKDPDGVVLHTVKPDRDNIDKAILDALTDAGWWKGDQLVCSGELEKFYHGKNGRPGLDIDIEVWSEGGE